MSIEQQQLETVIAGLEAQRALLGDALVDASLVPLRARLAALIAPAAAPVAAAPQTLKQVTILFLDVVGSTTLSQHLDPEDIHAVLDGALARCTAIVESHRGKVLQYAGDSLLAVFGADESREDDPERAVHAGLALLAEGRRQGEMVAQRHGYAGFNVRVGIHTGGVLLGGGVDGEGSIRGIAVNIAARMEQSAPAGALRISHDTYRHVRGLFDVEAQPPIEVKGVDTSLVTYLVQRAKTRAFRVATRGIEGVETRMVGRDAELELLQDAFKRLYGGDARFAAITVVAEAGIGKSRLLYEFENWAEARPETFYIFQGRANPRMRSQPYGLLRDILAWRLQIADSDSVDAAKQKIEQGIAPLFIADDGDDLAQAHAHLLGHLVGLDFTDSKHVKGIVDDPKQIRNRGFHAAAQMFRRVATQDGTPIVLMLDDLHWADEGSLEFLSYLAQVNRDVPMLVLGMTRPALFDRRPDWGSTEGIHQRIDLLPLDKGSSRLLANELLKKLPEIPAALRELITGGAEGNPFYMEELVKMLVDEGAIETGPEHWSVVPVKLLAAHVPQTLTGVLQARLDGLKPAEKLALQQASVIGFVFWDQALAAIDARAIEALPGLTERELVIPHQDTGLYGVREYAFKHQILHHVTYDTVLKRMRRECHAKAAAWLAGLTGARASDFLGAAAEHFEKAGDNAQASEYYTRAAEHAATLYAHDAVLEASGKALRLADADDHATRWRLMTIREEEFNTQGQREAQADAIAALQALAEASADETRRIEVAQRRWNMAYRTGDYHAAQTQGRLALELAQRAGAASLALRAQHMLAIALQSLGDLEPAKAMAIDGLALARASGDRKIESRFLNALAVIAARQDDLVEGHERDKDVLLICRELGNRRDEATALANLGLGLLAFGDFDQALTCLNEALRIARAVGVRYVEPHILRHLAALAIHRGDPNNARSHAQAAIALATETQDPLAQAVSVLCLADAEFAIGHIDAAQVSYQRAHELCVALDYPNALDAKAGLARTALAKGELGAAMREVDALLSHFAAHRNFDGTDSPQLVHWTCCRVLQQLADPRAAAVLDDAHRGVQAQASRISNAELRECFLTRIAVNREIVQAWCRTNSAIAPA